MTIKRVIIKIFSGAIIIICLNNFVLAGNSSPIYYEPTIKNIIKSDCSRCHSGAARNLMDYDSLKAYADTGLLASMVSGPMYRFAGNDAQTIIDWANNGAPEKSPGNQANFIQRRPMVYPNKMVLAATKNQIYYEPTIKNIIMADCSRCHSGASRNLMDYDSLKAYADTGLLASMVSGPMYGFAGNDAQTIIDWANNGAPEKSPGNQANFIQRRPMTSQAMPRCQPGSQPINTPADQITYSNTIKYVLDKDCLRCHSGPFRNLTTYQNVKIYVDNGLLKQLVQVGGPMHRFAGPDSHLIIQWINNGAPR